MVDTLAVTDDLKIFMGVVLGESSVANIFEEMAAIAAVLERQRIARKKANWADFSQNGTNSFAYGFSHDCIRNMLVLGTPKNKIPTEIITDTKDPKYAISVAYQAVKHVLSGGEDHSNGAFFWDGYDLTWGSSGNGRISQGFVYGDPSHNIFDFDEVKASPLIHAFKVQVIDNKKKKIQIFTDHAYISTTAFKGYYKKSKKNKITKKVEEVDVLTGTILWKFTEEYVKNFNPSGKEYV